MLKTSKQLFSPRFIVSFVALFALLAANAAWRVDDVPNAHVADSTRFVSNPDGVLSAESEMRLNQSLRDLQRQTTAEVAVVALNEIDGDIDDFATQLFGKWGIGKKDKDNGVLVLLAKGSHEVTIRTGRGSEGVVPDILAGRIIRDTMIPHFRNDDYDAGIEAGVAQICELIGNPDARSEMMSRYSNNRRAGDDDDERFGDVLFNIFVCIGGSLGIAMMIVVLYQIISTRKMDDISRYRKLDTYSVAALFLSFLGLGFPLPAYLLLKWKLKRLRNRRRDCPNCGTKMHKLDEQTDNLYLTSAQDLEERLNSVDYDVWLCDNCGNKEVIPFVNKSSAYTICPHCNARAMSLLNDRTLVPPTTMREGLGVRTFSCRNCGNRSEQRYQIPKVVAAAPIIGGGGNSGGGGFGGGSFGGGMTMGGGATGRW